MPSACKEPISFAREKITQLNDWRLLAMLYVASALGALTPPNFYGIPVHVFFDFSFARE